MRTPLRKIASLFPDCRLTEEKIRETILEILNFEDYQFVCFGCLSYIGVVNRGIVCDGCGQIYCKTCLEVLKNDKCQIDQEKCLECIKLWK